MPLQQEAEQARDYVRRLVLSAATPYWFTVVNPIDTDGWEPTYFGHLGTCYNGRFERDKGYAVKKILFFTFQRLTRYLRNAEFVEEIPLRGANAFAYRFSRADRDLRVAWLDDDSSTGLIDTSGWGGIGMDLVTGEIQTNPGHWRLGSSPIMFFEPLYAPSSEYSTIQTAIDAAEALDGWLVCVAPGTYGDPLTMKDRVDVYGPSGWSGAQCATLTARVTFEDVNTGSLCGFVLNPVSGTAVACHRSHPVLLANLYRNTSLALSLEDSDPKVLHSLFLNSSIGLRCRDSDPFVSNNVFRGGDSGILLEDAACRPFIINNTFHGLGGVAVRFLNESGMLSEEVLTSACIMNNIFSECALALAGNGQEGQPCVRYNLFWANGADASGCSSGDTPAILQSKKAPFSGLAGSRLTLFVDNLESSSSINVDFTSDMTSPQEVANHLNTHLSPLATAHAGTDSRIRILTASQGAGSSLRVKDRRHSFGGPADANPILAFSYVTALGSGGNLLQDPAFIGAQQGDFRLGGGSAARNAGNPEVIYRDPDASRNDVGAYGGEEARTPTPTPTPGATPTPTPFSGAKGDMEPDGDFDLYDVLRLVDILLWRPPLPTPYEDWAGDMDGDGDQDLFDILTLVDKMLER